MVLLPRELLKAYKSRPSSRFVDIDDTFIQFSVSADFTPSQFDGWTITPLFGYTNREAERENSLLSFRANNTDGTVVNCSVPTANAGCNGDTDAHYLTYNLQGDTVTFSSPFTDFRSNPEDFTLNVLIFRPTVDEDEESTFKLDFNRTFDQSGLKNVDFGFRYNDKTKTVERGDYRLVRTGSPSTAPGFEQVFTLLDDFEVDGTSNPYNGNQIFIVDPDKYLSIYFPNGFNGVNSTNTVSGTRISNRTGTAANASYEVNEKTINFYVSSDFDIGKLSLNTGVRFVQTDQTSIGSRVESINRPTQVITPVTIKNDYTHFLPSASLRYALKEELLLRMAYSSTLTRANLPQLSPSETIALVDATTLGTGTRGNPELQPFTSDNVDLGVEWYFEEEGLLAFNFFYKNINNLIGDEISVELRENLLPQIPCNPISDPCKGPDLAFVDAMVSFTTPTNAASAEIAGFEFSVQKPFSFLDGFGKDFGVLFNYTYTQSSADFGLVSDVRADGLPGLSENSFNAGLYYDSVLAVGGALDARLNYAWRDRYLAAFFR